MNGTGMSRKESIHQKKENNTDYIQNCQNRNNNDNSIGEVDPWTAWMYKPRTISLLLCGTCLLIWASCALDPESSSIDRISSVRRGLWAMIAVFLVYSWLQAPSTVLIRPHPAVWRLVHGVAVVYLVALAFLLFQNRDDARQYMKFLHPDLGVELPEISYGEDCRIFVPEDPKNKFINVYVLNLLLNILFSFLRHASSTQRQ